MGNDKLHRLKRILGFLLLKPPHRIPTPEPLRCRRNQLLWPSTKKNWVTPSTNLQTTCWEIRDAFREEEGEWMLERGLIILCTMGLPKRQLSQVTAPVSTHRISSGVPAVKLWLLWDMSEPNQGFGMSLLEISGEQAKHTIKYWIFLQTQIHTEQAMALSSRRSDPFPRACLVLKDLWLENGRWRNWNVPS